MKRGEFAIKEKEEKIKSEENIYIYYTRARENGKREREIEMLDE